MAVKDDAFIIEAKSEMGELRSMVSNLTLSVTRLEQVIHGIVEREKTSRIGLPALIGMASAIIAILVTGASVAMWGPMNELRRLGDQIAFVRADPFYGKDAKDLETRLESHMKQLADAYDRGRRHSNGKACGG